MASLYMGLVNRTALLARSWPEVKSATARSVLPHVSYSKSTWNVEEPFSIGVPPFLGERRKASDLFWINCLRLRPRSAKAIF